MLGSLALAACTSAEPAAGDDVGGQDAGDDVQAGDGRGDAADADVGDAAEVAGDPRGDAPAEDAALVDSTDGDGDGAGPDDADGSDGAPSGEDCTNGVDDDGDGRVDCHDPDCFDTPPCLGVDPASFVEPRRWRLTWSDEFNGPVAGREACYDNTQTPPQCLTLYWQVEPCPERALANLANLDKCAWSTFYLYNWMDNGQPIGEGVNAFDPELVTVTGGELVLSAAARLPEGGLPGDWSMAQVMTQYDCGNPPSEGYAYSTDCPILSGGLWSRAMGPTTGLLQTYGRFEVRARLPVGTGSWPAHWMLPQEGDWPGDGEIDIMEAVNWQPDEVAANFHDGVTIGTGDGAIHTHMSVGSMSHTVSPSQQADEYHIYAVEWDAETLRFYVDSHLLGTVREGTLLPNTDLATGDAVGDYPLEVPDRDFYMILNSTVAAFGANDYPDPRTFAPQSHHIDYVRAWAACDGAAEACPEGGTFDGANCLVGPLPDRDDLFIVDHDLVYPAEAAGDGCPDGGERRGDSCVVYDLETQRHTFTDGGGYYVVPACLESTLSDSPRCYEPCGGTGELQGDYCYLGSPPAGARAVLVGSTFGYLPLRTGERCPIGRDRETYCEVGQVPAGRVPTIPFDGDAWLINTLCDPAAFMPNCTTPCPPGTEYEGDGCYVASPPPGHDPFVWQGGFYYGWLDTAVYAARCPLGVDDGAHCYVGPAPPGFTPLIHDGDFWVAAACGNVPVLD